MKRLGVACVLCCCGLTVPAGTAIASQPPPRASAAGLPGDLATGFAQQMASHGASFLIGKLQDGALGSTGASIGNFLSTIGLGGNKEDVLGTELKAVNERLTVLQQELSAVNGRLDAILGQGADSAYSLRVGQASRLRGTVTTLERKLREIVAAPVADRPALISDWIFTYRRDLLNKKDTFEAYLTGGGPGADGILQLASKKARAAAQPFFTYAMSQFSRQVIEDYTMLQAVWLEEQLNFLHYEKRSVAQMQTSIDATKAAIDHEYRAIPPVELFPGNVIDTRTSLMWGWRITPGDCVRYTDEASRYQKEVDALLALQARNRPADFAQRVADLRAKFKEANRQYNLCTYGRTADAAPALWDFAQDFTTTFPSQGSPPAGWKLPTVDQLKALDAGATGGVPAWLNSRGGFPAKITGDVWTSERSGDSAKAYNQSTGAVSTRNVDEKQYVLVQGTTVDSWYWLK